METLPDVVKRKIFAHAGARTCVGGGGSVDWRMGAFSPPGRFNQSRQENLNGQLKFCLVWPDYACRLNLDLEKQSMEALHIASLIPSLSLEALLIANRRIRTNQKLLAHHRQGGKVIFRFGEFVDFLQPHRPHADWLLGLVVDYLSFLCDLRAVFFSTGDSLLAFAKRYNLTETVESLNHLTDL